MRNFIIGLIVGAGIGSGATYLIYKRAMTRKFTEELDNRAREEYEKLLAAFEKRDVDLAEAEAAYADFLKGPIAEAAQEALDEYAGSEDVEEDLAEAESPSEDDEDIVAQSEIEDNIQKELEKSRPKCKILKKENYGEIEGYECETLKFYVEDKILTHENGDVVEDIPFLIDDALDRYGWADDDDDDSPLHVRNYGLQRDYDIQKIYDEWHGAD